MNKNAFIHFVLALCLSMSWAGLAQADITSPKIQWRFKTEGPIRGGSVIHDQTVYFGSVDGYLYALNTANGDMRWKFSTGGALVGTPAVSKQLVVVTSRDGFAYGIDANTGAQIWRFAMKPELGGEAVGWQYFTAAPVFQGQRVYLGSGDGHLYAVDSRNGKLVWKFATQGAIRAAPRVTDDLVYQPSNDGFVYVLDNKNGKLKWKFETAGATLDSKAAGFDRNAIYTQPILRGSHLMVGSRDGHVYAIDTQTRQQAWNFSYGTTWAMATSADEQALYVGWSTNNLVSALDLASGKELWQFKAGAYVYTQPLLSDTSVYFGSADGKLYRVDKSSGEHIWQYDLQREIYSAPIFDAAQSTLFVGTDSGYFYAIANGPSAHKAVFLPEKIEGMAQYTVIDSKVTDYLKEKGFNQLDADALQRFLRDRILDKAPSVVVFALPSIPADILGEDPAQGLMRDYLAAGGKVIWFGDAPNYWAVDEAGNFNKRVDEAEQLLGVDYYDEMESGNYFSTATQQGRNWGLPSWLKTTATPVHGRDITPLAYDEFGRVSAYVKSFSNRPASGFVSIRTWAWFISPKPEELTTLHQLAVYGLE